MRFEQLESRRHLTATLENGVLSVVGTPGPDGISVAPASEGRLVVLQRFLSPVAIPPPPPAFFPVADVNQIHVRGLDGNDVISVLAFKPATTPSAVPGAPIPTTINGGAGNDRLMGNIGADVILGEAGDDLIDANGGDDRAEGGPGRDRIRGGPGADVLNGGDNNDFIDARDRSDTDTVDGGAHDTPPTSPSTLPPPPGDVAAVDSGDTVTNVERVFTFPPPTTVPARSITEATVASDVLNDNLPATL